MVSPKKPEKIEQTSKDYTKDTIKVERHSVKNFLLYIRILKVFIFFSSFFRRNIHR